MDMNELHSPGAKPAPWLPILQLSHQACLGNRVPGSKGTEGGTWALGLPGSTPAGWAKGRFHTRLDIKLAPFTVTDKPLASLGSLCGGRLGGTKVGAACQPAGCGSRGIGALLTLSGKP